MPRTLTDDELIEILEEIARNSSNQSARIQAIRALRQIEEGVAPNGDVDWLYESPPRRTRGKEE